MRSTKRHQETLCAVTVLGSFPSPKECPTLISQNQNTAKTFHLLVRCSPLNFMMGLGDLKGFSQPEGFWILLSAPSHFPSVSPWLRGWNFPSCSLDYWIKPEFPGFCVWTLLVPSCIISHKKFILACFCHSFEVSTSSKSVWRFSNRLYVEHCCQHLKIHISWRQMLGSRGSSSKVTAWTFVHWLKRL